MIGDYTNMFAASTSMTKYGSGIPGYLWICLATLCIVQIRTYRDRIPSYRNLIFILAGYVRVLGLL